MNEHAAYQPPPDRRWLKYVLLGGAVLFMLISFPLVWIGSEFNAARQRLAVVREVEEQGGKIYQNASSIPLADRSLAQQLVIQALGDECYSEVAVVEWNGENIASILPALSHVPEVQMLQLYKTPLTEAETDAIAKLPLEVISLNEVQLSPDQLQQLATNESLTTIVLDGAAASDEHLKRLPAFPALMSVAISERSLTTESLQPLTKIPNLAGLSISKVELESEEALATLPQLKNLKSLVLADLPINDSLFDKISPMSRLESLTIAASVEIPAKIDPEKAMETIRSLGNLRHLTLLNLPLTNQALQGISHASQLEYLCCEGSQITDIGVQHLVDLKHLSHLRIPGAQLTSDGIRQLAKLPALQSIDLSDGVSRTRANNFGLPPAEDAP